MCSLIGEQDHYGACNFTLFKQRAKRQV